MDTLAWVLIPIVAISVWFAMMVYGHWQARAMVHGRHGNDPGRDALAPRVLRLEDDLGELDRRLTRIEAMLSEVE